MHNDSQQVAAANAVLCITKAKQHAVGNLQRAVVLSFIKHLLRWP
jgi:hypothetical protein